MNHFIPTPEARPIPCQIIHPCGGHHLLIAVMDEIKPNGKRDFTNTDTHGSVLLIDKNQLIDNGTN